MSPDRALESAAFLFYVALALGLLVAGGIVLAVLQWRLRRDVSHAWRAYGGWLIIVPLLCLVYFLGREAVIAFLTAVGILAFHEFARATALDHDWVITAAVDLGIGAMGVACWMREPAAGEPGWYGLFTVLPILVIAMLLVIPVLRDRAEGQLRPVALAVLGFVYCGWMFGHLTFLANADHAYSYLGYLVLAVGLNDVAAYTGGKLFGRHLLRRHISPKKTWEGAMTALAVSCLLPWVLWATLPHFAPSDCVLVGLIVGIGGPLGDLVVSVMKRDLGLKDMGAALPGHGGILDRIDSLIYVAPFFFHYVRCRHGLHPLP